MSPSPMPSIALDQLFGRWTDSSALPPTTVTGLSLDSRRVRSGNVYFALQGTQAHGIDYAEAAVQNGAIAVVVDSDDSACGELPAALDVPLVRIPQLGRQLGHLASQYFGQPSQGLSVCGVTGTDGKTSVCRFVADALQQLGRNVGYIGTIGWGLNGHLDDNPLTTPDALTLQGMIAELRQQGADIITLEVSSHALVQGRVAGVDFDIAVLTNLGRDHLDYHGDLQAYQAAKAQLFAWPGLSAIVLNLDDQFGRELAQQYTASLPVFGFSTGAAPEARTAIAEDGRLQALDIQVDEQGLAFTLQTQSQQFAIRSPLLGRFNVENLLSCFAVLRALGIEADSAAALLGNIAAVPGRMERFAQDTDSASVVVDFAHTPQALQAALRTLRSHCSGRLWVVFGCGGDRDPGKRSLMGEVAAREADMLILTDDNPRTERSEAIISDILAGVPQGQSHRVIADRGSAIEHALQAASSEDWILIAGKGHEPYQIVGTEYLAFSDRDKVTALLAAPGARPDMSGELQ